jgi:hypothetical protein
MDHVSTSHVERQNLTMRMQMRRFTRLTNAFSKKVENHAYAVDIHFMVYNFARPHMTLTKATPSGTPGPPPWRPESRTMCGRLRRFAPSLIPPG